MKNRRDIPLIKVSSDRKILTTVVLSVLFGLAAGAVGMLVALAYGDLSFLATQGSYSTVPVGAAPRTITELPTAPSQDISRSVVTFYSTPGRDINGRGTYELASDATGSGIVLTSDGWIISHERAFGSGNKTTTSERAVVDGRSYQVQKIVTDAYSGIVFVKIDATDLLVTPFGKEADLSAGDQLFGFDASGGIRRLEVSGIGTLPPAAAAGMVLSSERMQRFPRLAPVSSLLPGTVLMDGNGQVRAIYAGEDGPYGGHAVPIGAFLRQVTSVLRNGVVSRPYLGVHYLDLSDIIDAQNGLDHGVLLSSSVDGRTAAVASGSPAKNAGLRDGDIIKAVNGELVSASNTLPGLLEGYDPGDDVTMSIERNGSPMTVQITLGDVAKQ